MKSTCNFALAILAGGPLAACSLDEVPDPSERVAEISSYRADLRAVSRAYTSDLAPNPQIELWISNQAVSEYQKIRPDLSGSSAHLPEGSVIVREVFTGTQVTKLTVMGKGPAGYNEVVGNWWFAVTSPTGVPLEENGVRLVGRLPQCVSCHDERGQDDHLFGVALAGR